MKVANAMGQVSKASRGRKIFKTLWRLLLLLLIVLVVFAIISPTPTSMLIRFAFRNGVAVAPDNYERIESRVTAFKDLTYPSKFEGNLADIYVPKDEEGPFPVVIWVHGGAFVGGDKKDIEIYATSLANEGFVVVCMNYRLAPEAKYPTPIVQTEEVYLWLKDIADTYSMDMYRLVLAGDSAGAHIVAQFAAIQSNDSYATEMKFEQKVPLETLKALLLYCGPYDVSKITVGSNGILNFFLSRAAWAYFGVRGWVGVFSEQATISKHITSQFPPTFITDGNTASFEEHGLELANALEQKNVMVETYFIPLDVERTAHEYQFIMNTPSGEESFIRTVEFLRRYTE